MSQRVRFHVQMAGHVVDWLVAFSWMVIDFFGLSDHFWAAILIVCTVLVTDSIVLIRYIPVHMGIGKPEDFVPVRHALAFAWARAAIIVGFVLCIAFRAESLIYLLTISYCAVAFISAVAPREPSEPRSMAPTRSARPSPP